MRTTRSRSKKVDENELDKSAINQQQTQNNSDNDQFEDEAVDEPYRFHSENFPSDEDGGEYEPDVTDDIGYDDGLQEVSNPEDEEDDDAPEEVSFSTARVQTQNEYKLKKELERQSKEQLKEQRRKFEERNLAQKKQKRSVKSIADEVKPVKKTVEIAGNKVKIFANEDDQINALNLMHVKNNARSNNRVISFKEHAIMKKSVKRITPKQQIALLRKQRCK